MNHDPIRWCFQCQQNRRRADFRSLPGLKRTRDHREVCEACYDAVMAARERIKQAGKKDTVPF